MLHYSFLANSMPFLVSKESEIVFMLCHSHFCSLSLTTETYAIKAATLTRTSIHNVQADAAGTSAG